MEPTHGQRASCRVKPVNVDDGLEGIMWVRCLGGVRLPTASYVLCPNLNKLFFSPREEGSRFFVACFLPTSRRYTFDLDVESTHGQPASCRARPVNLNDDLQSSMWIHGVGGEGCPRCPTLFIYPNLKKCLFFAFGEGSRFFVVCFLYTSGQMFFSQTPSRRLPHITGLRVNSLTLGWDGAPNERALFRFHYAIAVFAERCLARLGSPTKVWEGGVHEHCAGFAHAVKLRVSCPGEF